MKRYAIKIGEIYLRSDKPITEDEIKAVNEALREMQPELFLHLELSFRSTLPVDGH